MCDQGSRDPIVEVTDIACRPDRHIYNRPDMLAQQIRTCVSY